MGLLAPQWFFSRGLTRPAATHWHIVADSKVDFQKTTVRYVRDNLSNDTVKREQRRRGKRRERGRRQRVIIIRERNCDMEKMRDREGSESQSDRHIYKKDHINVDVQSYIDTSGREETPKTKQR